MGDTGDEVLVKIHVDLPNHWATGGEAFWAKPLGDDLFELRNVPFHAYDLNFLDVVLATSDAPDRRPEIRRVVRRSGHRTLRVIFAESTSPEERTARLTRMAPLGVTFEGANARYFALDVVPEGDYAAARASLAAAEEEGVLGYETCEARVEGSFDERPDAEDPNGGDST